MPPLLGHAPLDAAPASTGFSWLNLLIVLAVAAIVWPLFRLLRDRISRTRRARWAQEEQDWGPTYTEENDPDLRRDEPQP